MRLTCPCCGATLSLDALLNDTSARQAVATALSLPASLGPRLLRYIALFRPAQRSLTWERAAALLGELHGLISSGEIRRHGRPWRVTADQWASALDQIIDRRASLTLPLKSHGYLLEILAGQANHTEAQQETQMEEQRRAPRPETGAGMQSIQALMDHAKTQRPIPDYTPETAPPEPPPRPAPKKRTPPPDAFRNLRYSLRGISPPTPEPETHD